MPEEPQNPPLPPPPRQTWSAAERTQVLLGILLLIFTAVVAYPTIHDLTSGVPVSTLLPSTLGLAALVAIALFIAVGGPARIRRFLRERKPPEVVTANPDRMTELQILHRRAAGLWAADSNMAHGFSYVSMNILNRLNSAPVPPRVVPEDQKRSGDRANFIRMGWNAGSSADDAVFWEIGRLIADQRTTDPETFASALLLLRQVVLASISVANSFADEVRRADPLAVDKYLREEWQDFRNQANLLSDHISMLGEKSVKELSLGNVSFYFPPVRGIDQ
jgi:hypothetical protein